MAEVEGNACAQQFEPLREVLAQRLDSGDELGASVAVTVEGELVVDLWGGWQDPQRTRPWQADTIVNVWSTTKTMTSLAALVAHERGEIDVYAPVARYWPEFAANGKEAIAVRHLMSHTSGVSGWEQPVTIEDIYDWELSTSKLAGQAPWWEPGTASGYHALNQGHLVGEVIRRATGRPLKQYFAEEIAGPLGTDFSIGAPDEAADRIATIIPPPPIPFDLEAMDTDSPAFKTFTGPASDAEAANTAAWRRADIGAANGHGNARSVAQTQAVVANGGRVGGVQLLSPKTIEHIFDVQADGVDLVLGLPFRFGIGYSLGSETLPYLDGKKLCFWGGWGGSMIIIDLERRMTISYMMNKMYPGIVGNPTAEALITTVYQHA